MCTHMRGCKRERWHFCNSESQVKEGAIVGVSNVLSRCMSLSTCSSAYGTFRKALEHLEGGCW